MCEWPMLNDYFPPLKFSRKEPKTWNNGKEVPRLDLTSSTTPGLQIRVIGCCVAVPRSYWSAVPTPLFIYISQLLRDSFSVYQQSPIWEPPSHYSMLLLQLQVSPQSQSRCEPSAGLQLHRLSSASSQSGVSED